MGLPVILALLGCVSSWALPSMSPAVAAEIRPQASAPPPAGVKMGEGQIVQDLRSHLAELAAQDRFSGVVLLARRGRILFDQPYGFSDHAFGARNNLRTKFNLASDGKMFTAVAIAQLAEEGKLSYDDPLLKLVPDYPNKDVAARITIRELLTHTSGLGDIFGAAYFEQNPERFSTPESYLPLFADKPLLFEPGTRTAYSNAGYIVLGIVIEHISGIAYDQYLANRIFRPAGMSDSGCFSVADDVPNLALGYTRRPEGERTGGGGQAQPGARKVAVSLAPGSPAGGCYSTAGDMLRFVDAVENHQIVNAESARLLLSGQCSDWTGPMTRPEGETGIFVAGHAGGAPGVSSWVDIYSDLGYTVVVLSNYDDGAELVNQRLRWELTGHELPRAIRLPAAELKRLAGEYKAPPPPAGVRVMWKGRPEMPPIVVASSGVGLRVGLMPGSEERFLPLSPTEFFDEDAPGTRLRFSLDQQGHAVSLSFTGGRTRIIGAPKLP